MAADHPERDPVVALYHELLAAWNRRDASAFAGLLMDDGLVTGFDGSMMTGRVETEATLGQIFAHHPTATYVGLVRTSRRLAPTVSLIRAIAGMVPPGGSDINPALNAVQTLVAIDEGRWRVASFQNTPAAFHGRPEAVEQLTTELRRSLKR